MATEAPVAEPPGISPATYIHVFTPPCGNELRLPPPADGRRLQQGHLLRDGAPVHVAPDAEGVSVRLPAGARWDEVDTILALT